MGGLGKWVGRWVGGVACLAMLADESTKEALIAPHRQQQRHVAMGL